MNHDEKYDRLAEGFSEREYADFEVYAERCAAVVLACAAPPPGGSILDLACGDGLLTGALRARGYRYTGIDASSRMVEAAARRHPGARLLVGRIEEFEPSEPVDATVCLRAFYYPPDRRAFFARVASYTRGAFVFDFRWPDYPPGPILADLHAAGFSDVRLRPFFLPQRHAIPAPLRPLLYATEHSGPLAELLLRRFGRAFCVARR